MLYIWLCLHFIIGTFFKANTSIKSSLEEGIMEAILDLGDHTNTKKVMVKENYENILSLLKSL